MTRLPRLALLLAVLAWCALAVAAIVVFLGPLSLPAAGLSISRASRPLAAAGILALAAVWGRGGVLALLDDLGQSRAPYLATLLLVLSTFTALVVTRGAVSVGGADSAGYLAQAQRWATGRLHVPLPLAIPGVADPWVQSSLGMRPDRTGRGTVPTYPPGVPWIEAVALRLGGEAMAIRVLPLLAGLTALLALWSLAVVRAGHAGAALAVTCLASLPSFLYQALQPMSDVPALAAWLLALALASRPTGRAACGAALATLLAIVMRPNLAPLAAAVAWQAALPHAGRPRLRRGLAVGAGGSRGRECRGDRSVRPVRVAAAVRLRQRRRPLRTAPCARQPAALCGLDTRGRRLARPPRPWCWCGMAGVGRRAPTALAAGPGHGAA